MAVSRPAILVGIAVVALGLYWWSGSEPEVKAKTAVRQAAKLYALDADSEFAADDYDAHFDAPKPLARNLFMPLVTSNNGATPTGAGPEEPKDIIKIPADLAEGDGGWIYTGFAIVNGDRMALLENPGSHKAGYVKEGDAWKKAKVRRITSESIVLAGEDGIGKIVLRYNPDLAKKADAKTQSQAPANPGAPLQGPIGPVNPGAPNVQILPAPGGGVRIIRSIQP